MNIQIETKGTTAIYEQIMLQIKSKIVEGKLKVNEQLHWRHSCRLVL